MPKLELRPFSTNLDVDMIETIQRVAEDRRVSQADIVRDFLKRGYQDYERERALVDANREKQTA